MGYISRFVVSPIENGVTISREFKEQISEAVDQQLSEVDIVDDNGETQHFEMSYEPETGVWTIIRAEETYVYDRYASPSAKHWLGTDGNGMDMLTRLMYGGRVSLIIGFIVVIISGALGIIMGGIAGYFGKWVDNLIMRIVDVFYCIPPDAYDHYSRCSHGCDAGRSYDAYVLSDACPWFPWMAFHCPFSPGTDFVPPGTGIYDCHRSLRRSCEPPYFQASDS